MTSTASLPFKTKRISINSQTIKDLVRMENPRPFTESQVAVLVRVLRQGKTFAGSFAVNDIGGGGRDRYRLIDGNHRLEALKRVLQDDPTFRMEAEFHIYDHLNETQELDAFDDLNNVVNQTLLHRVLIRRKHFPIIDMMEADFPCLVAFKPGAIKEGFHGLALIQSYLGRHSLWGTLGGKGPDGRQKFYAAIAALGKADHEQMQKWARAFIEGLGVPGSQNVFSTHTGIMALGKIYFMNVDSGHLSHDEVVDRWKNRLVGDEKVRMSLNNRSIHALAFACDYAVNKMNEGHRRHMAITPKEYQALGGKKAAAS